MAAVALPNIHDRLPNIHDRWDRPAGRPPLRLVPPPPARRPSPAVLRRRRMAAFAVIVIVTAVLVAAVTAGVGALGGRPLLPAGSSMTPRFRSVAAETYLVHPGDTLWSIAHRMQPSGDVRPLVDRLAASRHGAALHPGDRIAAP